MNVRQIYVVSYKILKNKIFIIKFNTFQYQNYLDHQMIILAILLIIIPFLNQLDRIKTSITV